MSLESNFFPGTKNRRELFVANYQPLKSAGGEQRKKLTLRMPLGQEQSLLGMPDWIGAAYEAVAKDGNQADRINLDPQLKGMTLELYATPENEHRALLLTRCTLKGFHVVRVGKEEKAKFFLIFTLYTPNSMELHGWLNEHFECSVFASFDVDQSSLMDMVGEGDDEDEQEDDDDLTDDERYERARREAVKPEHDDEFPNAARTTPLVSVNGGRKRTSANA